MQIMAAEGTNSQETNKGVRHDTTECAGLVEEQSIQAMVAGVVVLQHQNIVNAVYTASAAVGCRMTCSGFIHR